MKHQKGAVTLIVVIVGAIVLAGGGFAAVSASSDSAPGDPLYSFRKVSEFTQVAISFNEADKAEAHLDIAEERLFQLRDLQVDGAASEHITEAASQLDKHQVQAQIKIKEASEQGEDVQKLAERLEENSLLTEAVLEDVIEEAPEESQGALQNALENSQEGLDTAIQHNDRFPDAPGANPGS